MTKLYFPFDDGAGAEALESSWAKMARYWRGDGVLIGNEDNLEVYGDSTGMQVKVKRGAAWVHGHYFESSDEETIAIDAADVTNPRIDRVVLELNWSTNMIDLVVLKGAAAASPEAPTLTQSSTIWMVPLAQVWVPANAATITVNDVLDERVYDAEDLIGKGRITLVKDVLVPDGDVTFAAPTSTDTVAETVTYTTLPKWAVTGQAVSVSATGGGLTAGTMYYISVSGSSFSFHLTLRDAKGGTNKVNLTAAIVATVYPARIYFVGGNCATISTSILGLNNARPYDVFLYLANGVPTLSLTAWTDSTTRATAIIQRGDGQWVRSGSPTYLYLGTIRTDASSMVHDSEVYRGVFNGYNRVMRHLYVNESTTHTYNGAARLWNNSSTNNLLVIINGLPETVMWYGATANLKAGADAQIARITLYINGAAVSSKFTAYNINAQYITTGIQALINPRVGYSYMSVYEDGDHASSAFANLNISAWMMM